MHTVSTSEATEQDLRAVLAVQQRAFGRVARSSSIDPARSAADHRDARRSRVPHAAGRRASSSRAIERGAVVGSVRGTFARRHGRDRPARGRRRLAASRHRQRAHGPARRSSYPDAERFELFTGAEAVIPLALYGQRGYRAYRREQSPASLLVWLEKPGSPRYDVVGYQPCAGTLSVSVRSTWPAPT